MIVRRNTAMELVEFEWLRSPDAYSIVQPGPPKMWRPRGAPGRPVHRWVIRGAASDPVLSTVGKKYFETYRPTEFPELFQRFADMPPTAEGVRDFYNKFGPLQFGSLDLPPSTPGPGWSSHSLGFGEALAHHAALRRAIELFESGDLSALSKGFNQGGWGRLRTELRPSSAGKLAMVLVPSSLIQFLWFQLAQYAGSDAKLLRCEQCNHPFLVGTGTSRTSKAKYCSDACRLAAFRERHGGHNHV
jgi:hypothetical protein